MAAGTTVARINTIVTASTKQFDAAMGKAETRAGKFAAGAQAAAKAASGPLTLGLIGAGAAAVTAAVQFDNSMTKIESLVGIAGEEVDRMKESVRGLSGETAQAPAKLADAMFFIQSAGLRGATAMETLEASAKAASVGLGDVTEIADLATSALNAYGEENLSAVQATDVLTAAVREGKLEASELAGSMGRVLPIASAMGVSFNEVGAAFAALSRTGTNAAEAATQVRGILASLLRPTKQAEEALTGMGLSSEGLRRQLREEGLLATLQTLAEEFDGNSAAAASVFGNIRALSGVMDLMGANTATTEQIFANMRDTTGTLDDAFAVVSDTAGFKFQQAMADLQDTLIGIGEKVIPIVLQMLEGVQFMIEGFQDMHPAALAAAAGITAIVVASGPIGQVSIALSGLFLLLGNMAGNAREAKERQAELTQEFIEAESPTHMMVDRMEELAAQLRDVGDAANEAKGEVETISGSVVATGLAIENGTLPQFENLGISMNDVAVAAEGGSDLFERMQGTLDETGGSAIALRGNFLHLEGAEREMAEALVDALEAGKIFEDDLDGMLDVLDETADAFDDDRASLEERATALLENGRAVEMLNDINLHGTGIIAGFMEQNLSHLEILDRVDTLVQNHTGHMNGYSVEAERAGVATGSLGDAVVDTEGPTLDLAEAFDEATLAAATLEDQFIDLMDTLLGESQAIFEAEQLARDFDDIIAGMAEMTIPEMDGAFFKMSRQAAASIGKLLDEGANMDSPEIRAVFENFRDNIATIGIAGDRAFEEISDAISLLETMSGIDIPVDVRLEIMGAFFGEGAEDMIQEQIGQLYGNTPGSSSSSGSIIGEAGPETVVPSVGISPGGAASLGPPQHLGGPVNVNINMPVGSDAGDIIRTLDDFSRRNGRVPITV